MLDKLKELIANSNDQDVEDMLYDADIDYEIISTRWIDGGKYRNLHVEIADKCYSFNESRNGSYYSDYYYSVFDVKEYKPDTRYHATYTFPNKEVAKKFVEFLECSGEGLLQELDIYEEDYKFQYDFDKCCLEVK